MSEYLYTTPPLDRSVGLRRHVMTTSMRSFGAWGYRETQVPLLHFFEAIRPGLDPDGIERSFRFVDRGGNLMILRPDVTPLIAQSYARMRSPAKPLRVSYTHKIVRVERAFTRDELESYQIGIEHIGGDSFMADVEVLIVALEVLSKLGLPDYHISIADHQVAEHLLRSSGVPQRLRDRIRAAVIARDADDVHALMVKAGARSQYVEGLLAMASLDGGRQQLERIRAVFPYDRRLGERLDYLERIDDVLTQLGFAEHASIELGELTGASYYTGIGFAIVTEGASREIGQGGRYDELIGCYGKSTPAVGFSISLGSVLQALEPHADNFFDTTQRPPAVAVDAADPVAGLRVALERRERGDAVLITSVNPSE